MVSLARLLQRTAVLRSNEHTGAFIGDIGMVNSNVDNIPHNRLVAGYNSVVV